MSGSSWHSGIGGTADMILLVDDITKVSHAVEIGRRTVQIAKQSIYVGLVSSLW